MLKFGIIGFGGMGKHHFNRYEEIKAKMNGGIELVALCDIEESAFTTVTETNIHTAQTIDVSAYNLYKNMDDMLEKEDLDYVVITLPTFLHAEAAIKAMNKGIHVFCEKPMAYTVEEAQAMLDTARKNNVKLMIGQCVRYMATYEKAKEIIDSGEYGKVLKASFTRYSHSPKWAWENWFMDISRSGGVMLDMHVHDVDFIQYLFGVPEAVTSYASTNESRFDSFITHYHYGDNMLITSDGEWCQSGFGFRAAFFIKMEKATIELRDGKLMLYPEGGEATELEAVGEHFTVREEVDFLNCVLTGGESTINPPEASFNSLKIALAEIESATKKEKVCF